MHFPITRLRRLRSNASIRSLISEIQLDVKKLVMPLFIKHGRNIQHPIASMPGIHQLSLDKLASEVERLQKLGIQNVILFGIPAIKDALGKDAYSDEGIIQQAIPIIKQVSPNMLVISDICFCEYTDHGHCGVVKTPLTNQEVIVDNDETLNLLAKQAISHAKAGADILAPSGNMDGMVQTIRQALDNHGFPSLPILSYAVKYASAMYGPFRQAAEGAPQFGDRKTYQMDFRNCKEALRECELDMQEGADMLMVKPAHTYLDIIQQVKQHFPAIPLCAYHTSGEYSMIKAAAMQGWIDEQQVVKEVLTAIHRAGADFIITYYAQELASWFIAEN